MADITSYMPVSPTKSANAAGNAFFFQRVDSASNIAPSMDAVGRAGFVKVTDGTNTMPTMDANARPGFQKITDGTTVAAVDAGTTALKVYIAGGSLGSLADEAAFTQGTTGVQVIAGDFKDAGTDLTDGQAGAIRATAKRALHTNLRNVEIGRAHV